MTVDEFLEQLTRALERDEPLQRGQDLGETGEWDSLAVLSVVDLFEQIGLGQWFRVVTGVVEVTGAVALLIPGLASIGALWLGGTMVGAVATHLFVLHTSPVPAIVLGVLNAVVV